MKKMEKWKNGKNGRMECELIYVTPPNPSAWALEFLGS